MSVCYWCCVKVLIELGFDIGDFFGIFENILKNLVSKKLHYFWVWRLFVVDYCDFGKLGVYMGLEFDIVLFVFCLRLIFGLFSVVRNVLKLWFCIVVLQRAALTGLMLEFTKDKSVTCVTLTLSASRMFCRTARHNIELKPWHLKTNLIYWWSNETQGNNLCYEAQGNNFYYEAQGNTSVTKHREIISVTKHKEIICAAKHREIIPAPKSKENNLPYKI